MTPGEFQRTETCQILADLIVRYLLKRRAETLDQVDSRGPITPGQQAASNELDQLDGALTGLGVFDTAEPGEHYDAG